MWCPLCKTEYIDGITECPECNVKLVDTLDEDSLPLSEEELSKAGEQELLKEETAMDIIGTSNKSYVSKKDKYSDVHSTAILFLVFGILGLVYTVLCSADYVGRYKFFNNQFQCVIATIMFLIFIGIGIASYIQAKNLRDGITDEENSKKEINEYIKLNLTQSYIDSHVNTSDSDEEKFFIISESMLKEIKDMYPRADDELISDAIDTYYNENF